MPPLKDVTTMVTAARSRNIRFNFIIQNYAQLSKVYGKEEGDTIKGNCGNIIYLISSEIAALEEISKMCGEVKSKEKEKTSSMPLVTVSDLQRLPQWTMIVLRLRMMPFKTKMKPNWQMEKENLWGKSYPKAKYPTREKHEIELFDVKGFVQKYKEEKINEMMNGNGSMPFMPSPKGPSPFIPPMFNQPNPNNSFNVDDLVKRIDAKIAELEAEEEKEKQEEERKQHAKATKKELDETIIDGSDIFEDIKKKIDSKEEKKQSKPANKDLDATIIDDSDIFEDIKNEFDLRKNDEKPKHNSGITDDQFFDDFFNDDE